MGHELQPDGEIEFDDSLPGVDPAVIAAFEQVSGESAGIEAREDDQVAGEEPEEEVEVEASAGTADPEPETDWKSEAERLREQVRSANHAAAQARIRQKQIDQRLEQFIEMQRQQAERAQAPAPEPEIDFEEDPQGWIARENERTRREIEGLRESLTPPEPTQEEQAAQQLGSYISTAKRYEEQFRQKSPDYDEAVSYAQEQLLGRMRDAYGDAPLINPQTGDPVFAIDQNDGLEKPVPRYLYEAQKAEMAFVAAEMQAGRNPAETYYKRAQEWGWSPNGEEAEPEDAPAPAPPQKGRAGEHVRQGLKNNRSLSKSSGATISAPNEITAEKFMELGASSDPQDQALANGIWAYNAGSLATQIMRDGKAKVPGDLRPLRL